MRGRWRCPGGCLWCGGCSPGSANCHGGAPLHNLDARTLRNCCPPPRPSNFGTGRPFLSTSSSHALGLGRGMGLVGHGRGSRRWTPCCPWPWSSRWRCRKGQAPHKGSPASRDGRDNLAVYEGVEFAVVVHLVGMMEGTGGDLGDVLGVTQCTVEVKNYEGFLLDL